MGDLFSAPESGRLCRRENVCADGEAGQSSCKQAAGGHGSLRNSRPQSCGEQQKLRQGNAGLGVPWNAWARCR